MKLGADINLTWFGQYPICTAFRVESVKVLRFSGFD